MMLPLCPVSKLDVQAFIYVLSQAITRSKKYYILLTQKKFKKYIAKWTPSDLCVAIRSIFPGKETFLHSKNIFLYFCSVLWTSIHPFRSNTYSWVGRYANELHKLPARSFLSWKLGKAYCWPSTSWVWNGRSRRSHRYCSPCGYPQGTDAGTAVSWRTATLGLLQPCLDTNWENHPGCRLARCAACHCYTIFAIPPWFDVRDLSTTPWCQNISQAKLSPLQASSVVNLTKAS